MPRVYRCHTILVINNRVYFKGTRNLHSRARWPGTDASLPQARQADAPFGERRPVPRMPVGNTMTPMRPLRGARELSMATSRERVCSVLNSQAVNGAAQARTASFITTSRACIRRYA